MSARLHGTRTYEWLNQQAGESFWGQQAPPVRSKSRSQPVRSKSRTQSQWKPAVNSISESKSQSYDPDRSINSKSRSKSKPRSRSKSLMVKSELIQGRQKDGIWRKKDVTVKLQSLKLRDLVTLLSGSGEEFESIEQVFVPNLDDAVSKVLKMNDPAKIRRCQLYLIGILEMCVKLASKDMWKQIEYSDEEERKVFRYNLWLLGNACVQLLDHLGASKSLVQLEGFVPVFPVYFKTRPLARDLPAHKQAAAPQKKK